MCWTQPWTVKESGHSEFGIEDVVDVVLCVMITQQTETWFIVNVCGDRSSNVEVYT